MELITLDTIAGLIQEVTGISGLGAEQDFYESGVTSVQSLPLLLELETRFEVAIPDDQFIQARTVLALREMLERLRTTN